MKNANTSRLGQLILKGRKGLLWCYPEFISGAGRALTFFRWILKQVQYDGNNQHNKNNNRFPNALRRTLAGRTGFTLIELLVVVLIIGILASVAVPQYTKAVEKSRAAGVIQKVKSLQNAVDMYLLANDWPTVQFTNLSGTSGRENLDISFKANATMKRSGLAVSYYMVFDDYYFYVVCERNVCYIIAEDNKPYKEQIVRVSWYRYKNYTRYQPMDTWNRGTCQYKSDSSAGKAICEYFKQNSLLSNNNWEISAKS